MADNFGLGFDWSNVINQGFEFGKTFINAKYDKDTAKHVAAAQASLAFQNSPATTYSNINNPGNAPGPQVGAGLAGFIQSIADTFGVSSSTVMIGGLGGLYLLFRDPPRRR